MKKIGRRYSEIMNSKKKGFTLIELVVVIATMAVLALVLVPNLTAYIKKAEETKIQANMKSIHTAAEIVDKTEGNLTAEKVKLYSNAEKIEILDDFMEDTYTVDKDDTGQITIRYRSDKLGGYVFPNIDHNEGNEGDHNEDVIEGDHNEGDEARLFKFEGQALVGFNYDYINSELGGVQPTVITIPSKNEDGSPVTSIGESAFYHKQLTSVVIPDSITYIGRNAFRYNDLTSITIPDSVVKIDRMAFRDNKLTSVSIPNSVTEIGSSAFENNELTSVVIANSVTSIGWVVFGDYSDQITGAGNWSWNGDEWVNN